MSASGLIKNLLVLIISSVLLSALSGCAGFKYLDGSSDKAISDFGKPEELKSEVHGLRSDITGLRNEIKSRDDRISALTEKLNALSGQVNGVQSLNEEMERLRSENLDLREKLSALEQRLESEYDSRLQENKRTPKIKVLSGTGKLRSAKKISEKLETLGYMVLKIDYAQRDNFISDVVYYSPDFQGEAEGIAQAIGGEYKPLTWFSVFDIIVVAGEDLG